MKTIITAAYVHHFTTAKTAVKVSLTTPLPSPFFSFLLVVSSCYSSMSLQAVVVLSMDNSVYRIDHVSIRLIAQYVKTYLMDKNFSVG